MDVLFVVLQIHFLKKYATTMAFRYPYNPSNSGFMLVFFSIWVSIHSAAAFPNPISILRRSEVACADANVNDSSGHRPRPLFCRPRDHPRRKPQQQHHQRRELISFRLWSSTGVDESSDNDNDLSNRKAKASSGVLAFLVTGYRRYLDLCRRRPFLTSSLTAGILAASGDALSQSIQAGRGWIFLSSTTTATTVAASFNWVRWRTFLLTGLLFEGPWVSFWYQGLWRLGRWMETSKMKVLTSSRLQVLVQTVIDQTVGVSIFFPLYFLVYEIIGAVVSGGGMYCMMLYEYLFQRRCWKQQNMHAC
jgi:hypothetical protein